MNLTIKSYLEGIQTHQFSAKEVVNHYLQKAKLLNPKLNACVRFNQNYIDQHLESFSQKSLAALPIMVKDNILIE
jgi:hypothetical protein